MKTLTLPSPVAVPEVSDGDGDGDGLVHVYCCDPERSLCGLDLTDHAETGSWKAEDECVVCLELEKAAYRGPCMCKRKE
jgi:hypothetical protein